MVRLSFVAGLLFAMAMFLPFCAPAPLLAETLAAPGQGEVRGLIVGIDKYATVVRLRGAVADARDLEGAMRKMGVKDVTLFLDEAATRGAVLAAFDSLLARTKSGDLVIISLAGHGSREPERVKGSSPDGRDEVFLLAGFDPKTGPGGAEKLLNHEFNHYIKLIEGRGAQVMFVADTCYGGGLAREIDPRAGTMSYRQVAKYRLADDELKPVSTAADAYLTPLDFERTTFLAAVDRDSIAPEVLIDGTFRGALSFAVARALEGAADKKGDGRTTLRELFSYVSKIVYEVSDQRQNIVAEPSPNIDPDQEVVLVVDRGQPAPNRQLPPQPPIRLAASNGHDSAFDGLVPLKSPFEIVARDTVPPPDLIWDSIARDAIVGGDIIAHGIDEAVLPAVIDRTAAVRDIKRLLVETPQAIRVRPDDSVHRNGSTIEVEVAEAKGSALVLFDIAGDGTVQMLYPTGSHRPVLDTESYRISFRVREPFGADEVVAITARQRMRALEEALHQVDGRRAAGDVAGLVARLAPADAKVGLVGLYTMP